jgi:polysaccharide export outer membrane protein
MYDVDEAMRQGTFASAIPAEYKVAPGDRLRLAVFTNKAYNQVNTMIAGFSTGTSGTGLIFVVQLNGEVFLPVIGSYSITGLTIPEAEAALAVLYDKQGFTDPLVKIEVINRRAFVYTGGAATVVDLSNEAVTLIEVLTLAGGLPDKAKADHILLIREVEGQRQVQEIDMSDEQALANGEIIIQPNDIVYVEPVRPVTVALREIVSVVAIASGLLSTYLLITR